MSPKSKLDDTEDFLKLYVYQCGLWRTPKVWHLWSGLSLMAACCGNNVFMQIAEEPLYPNLYIFLIGASGLGKGHAIGIAEKFIQDQDIIINKYSMRNITKQGLTNRMVDRSKLEQSALIHGARVWLITKELANSMPAGPMAMQFIMDMTDMFDGITGETWDMTRGSGALLMNSPVVNWIAGSTTDWLFDSLDSTAVSGGFFARAFMVWGEAENDEMEPSYPFDRKEIKDHLKKRVELLSTVKTEMVLSPRARAYLKEEWYPHRQKPEDSDKEAMWNREKQLVWKLSMLICLSEQDFTKIRTVDPVIREHHTRRAVNWLNAARGDIDQILQYANKTRETIPLDATLRVILKHGKIQRTQLIKSKALVRLGVRSNQLNEIIRTLEDRGQIEVERSESGATFYKLKKRRAF